MGHAPEGRPALAGARVLAMLASIPIRGMERSNLQVLRMLVEQGADVLVVTHPVRAEKMQMQDEVERIGARWVDAPFGERLRIPRSPAAALRIGRDWLRVARAIHGIYTRYRPTHIYLTSPIYIVHALPTLALAPEPAILRLPQPPGSWQGGLRSRLDAWIWRRLLLPICDVLVCNSAYSRIRLGGLRDRATVIHNCVPERAPAATSDAPAVNRGRLNVVFLGQLHPAKGLRELVDAAVRIVRARSDVDFLIAGDHAWRNPFAQGLIDEIAALGLGERIRFVGEVVDVFGLLDRCHVHVLPSLSESFPNVVLEAKSRGLPSVVFPSGGIPEAVVHGVDGFLCAEPSAAALEQGLLAFLDDPAALAAAGAAARRSLERFSRARAAELWVELFARSGRFRTDAPA